MDEEAYINEILNLQAENDRLRRDYQELLTKTKAALERMESLLNLS